MHGRLCSTTVLISVLDYFIFNQNWATLKYMSTGYCVFFIAFIMHLVMCTCVSIYSFPPLGP